MTIKNLTRLMFGLFLYALGLVITVKANLGVTPWNTFHQGLSLNTGITLGQAIIITGVIIVVLNVIAKEKVGIGTISNMLFIGMFVDLIIKWNLVPQANSLIFGLVLIFIGMVVIALASWLYIGSELGAGPRDGLMVTFARLTGKPIGFARGVIELGALIIGVLLGGQFGIGTPIMAILIGPIVQYTFKIVKFDVKNVNHQYLSAK